MLVLSDSIGRKIYIGEDVTITLLPPNRDGRATVGIDAPAHVRIVREVSIVRGHRAATPKEQSGFRS